MISRIEKQLKRRFAIGSQVSENSIVQDFTRQVPNVLLLIYIVAFLTFLFFYRNILREPSLKWSIAWFVVANCSIACSVKCCIVSSKSPFSSLCKEPVQLALWRTGRSLLLSHFPMQPIQFYQWYFYLNLIGFQGYLSITLHDPAKWVIFVLYG